MQAASPLARYPEGAPADSGSRFFAHISTVQKAGFLFKDERRRSVDAWAVSPRRSSCH